MNLHQESKTSTTNERTGMLEYVTKLGQNG